MFSGFKQGLFAWFPILGLFPLGRFQHTFINQPLAAQAINRAFDEARAIEGFFTKEVIHFDAKDAQIFADQIHHRSGCKFTNFGQPNIFALIDISIAYFVLKRLTNWYQVITWVCAILKRDVLTMRLKIAQIDRARQNIDLCAAVIDVVFTCDVIACVIQQAGQCIAKNRTTGMTNVQRSRWVGRHIFHVHALSLPHVRTTIGLWVGKNG